MQAGSTPFKRSRFFIRGIAPTRPSNKELPIPAVISKPEPSASIPEPVVVKDLTVLVINASHDRAKEITMQLSITLPGAGMIYAPTVELAKWVLNRRRIDLIVADQILPDGNISKLAPTLEKLSNPPDLVVVGTLETPKEFLKSYQFKKSRSLPSAASIETKSSADNNALDKTLYHLGNDLRNDLNNPLQAIVAMLFVAQSNKGSSNLTDQALNAIETATSRMAQVVSGLEGKIREAFKS